MNRAGKNIVSIRKALARDRQAILALISRHRAADARQAVRSYQDYFETEARARDLVLVAHTSGRIVGVSGYWYDDYCDNDVYWLNWTYVDPAYQSQGIGSRLLRRVFQCLRKNQARKLFVDTSSKGSYHAALQFYMEHGFQVEGVLKDYYGPGEDQIILGKELEK